MGKKIKTMLFICLLVCLGGCKAKEEQSIKKEVVNNTPTLFIHGSSGNEGSFKGMINRFEKQNKSEGKLLLNVSSDGEISVGNDGNLGGNNPMVQVLFEDNNSDEWHQADWLKAVLIYLKENEKVQEVNIVGHSMGGIAAIRYLTSYGTDDNLPKINKVVTLGAPFNGFIDTLETQSLKEELVEGPNETEPRYEDYASMTRNIPQKTDFLLIGGKLSDDELNDGIVPLSSALAVTNLLKGNGNNVDTVVISGDKAEHSALHENEEVDKKMSTFLWTK